MTDDKSTDPTVEQCAALVARVIYAFRAWIEVLGGFAAACEPHVPSWVRATLAADVAQLASWERTADLPRSYTRTEYVVLEAACGEKERLTEKLRAEWKKQTPGEDA